MAAPTLRRPWSAVYENMSGYDCMSDAWVVYDADGGRLFVVDLADYECHLYSGPKSETGAEIARRVAMQAAGLEQHAKAHSAGEG